MLIKSLRSREGWFSNFSFRLILLFALVAGISSCTKDELIENTIPGNVPPPDQTIEDVTINNYINRVYVSVLARKPTDAEKDSAFTVLRKTNVSGTARKQFLDSVFNNKEYLPHLYDFARADLLQNLDTTFITQYLIIFNNALTDTAQKLFWDVYQYEIYRLDTLQRVPQDLKNHTIDIVQLHKRCVNNYFYDQINMGTENFVVSCFQHFLNRYPTTNELTQAENIVNGSPGALFLQSGLNKNDFLNIFFSSLNYYEGLATNLYSKFLARKPNSIEMGNATEKFKLNQDYVQMQKDILITNEYIGIK